MQTVDLSQISAEELEQLLQQKRQLEKEERMAKKEAFESTRDQLIDAWIEEARDLNKRLTEFKSKCISEMFAFREQMQEYGGIRKNSKGGFQIRHSETGYCVVLRRNAKPEYDERADMAEDLIKDFLSDSVKKRSMADYRAISALLEKNKKGEFTPGRISAFLKIKDNYDDPRWLKAMTLFEESFNVREISFSVEFYEKDELGKDQILPLNFSAIAITEEEEEELEESPFK
jgi:hypothetical protein